MAVPLASDFVELVELQREVLRRGPVPGQGMRHGFSVLSLGRIQFELSMQPQEIISNFISHLRSRFGFLFVELGRVIRVFSNLSHHLLSLFLASSRMAKAMERRSSGEAFRPARLMAVSA